MILWIEIWAPIHPAPVLLFYLSNKTVACDKNLTPRRRAARRIFL